MSRDGAAPQRLIIFARAPRLGLVKTRLASALGPQAALEAYRLLVQTLVQNLAALAEVELRYAPDTAGQEVQHWLLPGWHSQPQGTGDLGARMHRAFLQAFQTGAKQVALIGSDCPSVTVEDIRSAWSALEDNDLALGPACDGGYWLIGLRQPQPALFEGISWGTDAVLRESIARARNARLTTALLRQLPDVDTEQDWREFLQEKHALQRPEILGEIIERLRRQV
jgi:hypothetical protein